MTDKPRILHTESSPMLSNVHGHEDIASDSSDSDTELDLLEYLNRIDLSYRDIKFRIPNDTNHKSESTQNFVKRVAFDTIDIQYQEDSDDDGDWGRRGSRYDDVKGTYDFLFDESRGRSRSKVSPTPSPLHSPSASPIRTGVSPIRNSITSITNNLDVNMAKFLQKPPDYPTQPIITHKGCTYTKKHKDFEGLYLGKVTDSKGNYLRPVLPRRVILVYISGRRHTWVALDWILSKFIENGDSVIIVSSVHESLLQEPPHRRRKSYGSSSPEFPRYKTRKGKAKPETIKLIARKIMNYSMELINPNVIAKVSIELAVGETKQVLKEMYKLYEPSVVATGSKPRTNIAAPLRSWTSSKLTDRLVKNFPLPLIVTPAVNMGRFERDLRKEINYKYKFADDDGPVEILRKKSFGDLQSMSSISSDDSYSSFEEITNIYEKSKRDLHNQLNESLTKNNYTLDYFVDALKMISQNSIEFCEEIRSIDPNFKGKGAKLAGAITGSNKWGQHGYKTKSLLEPVEKAKTDVPTVKTPKISLKDLKRNLKEKERQLQVEKMKSNESVNPPPSINIISPGNSNESLPPKQTLKFVGIDKNNKEKDIRSMKKIQKSLSNDDSQMFTRPALEPLKSHPDLTTIASGSSKGDEREHKKKKLKFWKLFK